MIKLFSKIEFPKPLGGNLYEFKEAESKFSVLCDGFFVIKVIATAKNAKLNHSTDDDDLRMSVDDFSFGKYETKIVLYDVYGFQEVDFPSILDPGGFIRAFILNVLDMGEDLRIIKDFEVQIFVNIAI